MTYGIVKGFALNPSGKTPPTRPALPFLFHLLGKAEYVNEC